MTSLTGFMIAPVFFKKTVILRKNGVAVILAIVIQEIVLRRIRIFFILMLLNTIQT